MFSINCGLLALGNVISALGDEARKASHVPYRWDPIITISNISFVCAKKSRLPNVRKMREQWDWVRTTHLWCLLFHAQQNLIFINVHNITIIKIFMNAETMKDILHNHPLIISQKESKHRNLRNSPSEIAELHNFSLYGKQAGASAAGPTWPIS